MKIKKGNEMKKAKKFMDEKGFLVMKTVTLALRVFEALKIDDLKSGSDYGTLTFKSHSKKSKKKPTKKKSVKK